MAVTTIKIRRDTIINWESVNPILEQGEPSYDITNRIIKIGDGSSNWIDLPTIPRSDSRGFNPTESQIVNNAIVISNSAFEALTTKDPNTIYYVVPSISIPITTENEDILTTENSDTIFS